MEVGYRNRVPIAQLLTNFEERPKSTFYIAPRSSKVVAARTLEWQSKVVAFAPKFLCSQTALNLWN